METVQVTKIHVRGHDANIHVTLEDIGGDSAIIEFADGPPVVHHGRQYTSIPPTISSSNYLLRRTFRNPAERCRSRGTSNAVDRFQRAAYYSALLPKP